MAEMSFREAIRNAMADAMREDNDVVLMGEDLRGGKGGTNPDPDVEAFGGVFGVTEGLWTEFGDDRVIDTPITESAIMGLAAGSALTGLRPVAELMFMDFLACATTSSITKPPSSATCSAVKQQLHW